MIFYRAFRFPWSGSPAESAGGGREPQQRREETIVHMSWNGATGVASWRVLAGPGRDRCERRPRCAASRLRELDDPAPRATAYVSVQALDSAGDVLGTSHTVPVNSYAAAFPTARRSG